MNLTLWYLPEEERQVLGALFEGPTLLAAPLLSPTAPGVLPSLIDLLATDDPSGLFVLLPADLPDVVTVPVDGGYGIHAMRSPVLQLSRARWRAPGELGQASLSAYLTHPDGSVKSAEFARWAKRVIGRVRKAAPGHHRYPSYRITAEVEAALTTGLKLVF